MFKNPPAFKRVEPGMRTIATLALGLRPRQALAKVRVKSELRSHISCSQECKRV